MKNINKSKPKNIVDTINRIKLLDYAVFDFDGTIYPNLFLFDLAKKLFVIHKDKKKLDKLYNIAEKYKNNNFIEAYTEFVELLKSENKKELICLSEELINHSYKKVKLCIKKLKSKYKLKCYLISITSDFVANIVKNYFGFDDVIAIQYLTDHQNRFIGKTIEKIDNPKLMKLRMFEVLFRDNNKRFIYFSDSLDDLLVARYASIRVGLNPDKNSLKVINYDIVIKNKDPWGEFYKLMKEPS